MKRFIKPVLMILLLVFIIAIVCLLILKYEVEGEISMPFYLSRIIVISSAEGIQKENTQNIWDLELLQNNDIYIEINKNEDEEKQELIENIVLDNFQINKSPLKGELNLYEPTQDENNLYKMEQANSIKDKIIYKGSQTTNMNNLEIANQGGRIGFRYTNQNLGTYTSNEQEQITHDGTILQKLNIKSEELKAEVSFDITISLVSQKKYKANISLEFPTNDIVSEGTGSYEKVNMDDVVFKRI